MLRDGVRRTFEEEAILKKFTFEKTAFMKELVPNAEVLRQAGYCTWRESVQKNVAIYQSQMGFRMVNTTSDISNIVNGLETDKNFMNVSIVQRLCQSLKEKTANQMTLWNSRRQHLATLLDIYRVD